MNLDSPLYSGFVKPELCKLLFLAGITGHTPYHYRIVDGLAELNTYAFDRDDFYAQAMANMDYVRAAEIVPAYQLKEVEKVLPDYLLCRNNGAYEVTIDRMYEIHYCVVDRRLPDAFACMLLEAMKRRIIYPAKINELITKL